MFEETSELKLVLAWPIKLQNEVMSLFETRYRLHKRVYTHHTVKAIEQVVTKILIEIKEVLILIYLNPLMILFHFHFKIIQ